jgi:hypothetical protein
MAAILFYVDEDLNGLHDISTAGSGLGFYGSGGFGNSVAVSEYQDNTFVTDSNGATQGAQTNNVKYISATGAELPGAIQAQLQYIPNSKATLNIRFTNDSAVEVQNAELRIYDRVDITAGATGVLTQAYECLNLGGSVPSAVVGSGLTSWTAPSGNITTLPLAQSPGISGLYAGDGSASTHEDTQHDWYVCLSASPNSVGSKTQYGMVVLLEYL